jgi:Flp pilus assembly protein TadG
MRQASIRRRVRQLFRRGGASAAGQNIWADQSGITALQFALALPAILATIMGTIEMGQLMMAQSTLVHAASEGTRYAMVRGSTAETIASETEINTFVKDHLTGLDTAKATVSVQWQPNNQPGAQVVIDIDYAYDFAALHLDPITLSGSSTQFVIR